MVDSSAFFLLLTLLSLLMPLQQSVDLLRHHCDVMVHHYERRRVCVQARGVILWCLIAKLHLHLLAWPAISNRFFWLLRVLVGLFLNIVIFSKTVAM